MKHILTNLNIEDEYLKILNTYQEKEGFKLDEKLIMYDIKKIEINKNSSFDKRFLRNELEGSENKILLIIKTNDLSLNFLDPYWKNLVLKNTIKITSQKKH